MTESSKIIGGFRVLKDLKAGAGSQGTVYQAVCEEARFAGVAVGDMVALKVMAVQDDDGKAFARLERRTADLVKLGHPNVVKYFGCLCEPGPFNDLHVIVQEYVEGRSLKEMLEVSPCGLGTDEALRIAFGLVSGLAYTASCGIVHRDIKPGNVIVRPDGTPKLIDFEVARREDGTATVGGSNLIGTFDYMAPDFTAAEFRGDERSDVFSMGVCLHEMLTGRTPYRRQSGTSTQANVAFLQRWLKTGSSANPVRVSSRVGKLLVGARDLIERALEPERARRLPDFASFRAGLEKVRFREIAHGGHVWRLQNYIGHGGFGEVFRAVDCASGASVAVKHLLNAAGLERFRREAHALRKVASPCFTAFVDWFTSDEGDAFLVMDYLAGMPGSSMRDVMKANGGKGLERSAVLTAFIRYAQGLAELHRLGIVHRDIKPANLYLPVKEPERAVIMDLGIVRDLGGTATVGQVPGTLDFMPPECVSGKTRGGPEADVWAYGLCLYEALTGRMAYPRLPEGVAGFEAYFKRVRDKVRPDFSGVSGEPELRRLLEDMCVADPAKRIRDIRQVERRLRLINGENADMLPVLAQTFVWQAAASDADFDDAIDVESESGMTLATVCGDAEILSRARADLAGGMRTRKRRLILLAALPLAVVLLAAGVKWAWQGAEAQRRESLAEAERRAQAVAEEMRAREAVLRQERVAAERKAEEERARAEEERIRAAEAYARAEEERRKAEAERLARERIEAETAARKAREKAEEDARKRAQAIVERQREEKARAEEAAKKEADRIRAEQEAEKLRAQAEERERQAEELKRKETERARQAEERAREAAETKVREAMTAEADRAVQTKIAELDAAFEKYTRRYRTELEEALKPGSRIDPVDLQQAWLVKKRAYRIERGKLEKKLTNKGGDNAGR